MTHTPTIRFRKVRRILRLEARADRQETRHAKAATRAELFLRRVEALRTEARALEASLTGGQRAELTRARLPHDTTAVSGCPWAFSHRHAEKET